MVSKSQVNQKMLDVQDFRNACIRNNFLVPKHNSRLCTREFLQEVRAGQVFVPKVTELKCAPCPEPPCNDIVRQELINVLQNGIANVTDQAVRSPYERLVWHLQLRAGDLEFHLQMLAHLTEGRHAYFQKDYRPPPKVRANAADLLFNNDDGFFDNLPDTKKKGKRSQASRLLFDADQRRIIELEKEKKRAEDLLRKVAELQAKEASSKGRP